MFRSLFALLSTAVLFVACTPNNVTVDNSLQKYFDSAGVKGSFGLLDNGQGNFTIYDLHRFKDSAYRPGATFDILESLIALQTGVVKDDSGIRAAFQTGDRGVFDTLAVRIGKDTMRKWVDSLRYGKVISANLIAPSVDGSNLKITCDEQLGLIKRLYFGQLPFFNRPQKLVVSLMPSEGNSNYHIYYKSGVGKKEDGSTIAWVLGWIEENKHPYFFVINLESSDTTKDLPAVGLQIVKKVLGPMGFFDGKK